MEQKFVRVPFDLQLAKEITNGEVNGRVVNLDGKSVRIICWDRKGDCFPIIGLVDRGYEEEYKRYNVSGEWNPGDETYKNDDLFIEIPEYMTFKDGDVLTYYKSENRCSVFVYQKNGSDSLANYVECEFKDTSIIIGFNRSYYSSKFCRKATEQEKQKLIEALKASKDQKAKEYLKRFLGIEENTECQFKPFDKVVVRENDSLDWEIDFFMKYEKEFETYRCMTGRWKQCLPFNEETEKLIGSTKSYNSK